MIEQLIEFLQTAENAAGETAPEGAVEWVERAARFIDHADWSCVEHHDEACEYQQQCDEPGCKRETTSGWKDETGVYRRTCSQHSQWGVRSKS